LWKTLAEEFERGIEMPVDLSTHLVIGISSRALFDLSNEDEIFKKRGLEAYAKYQLENENVVLKSVPSAKVPYKRKNTK
jgi:hypothetical protein